MSTARSDSTGLPRAVAAFGDLSARVAKSLAPRLSNARRSLAVLGVFLVLAIGVVTALLISAERTVVLEENQRTAANLGQVLAEQTSRSMQSIDLALRGITDRLASIAVKSGDPLDAVMRSAATFDMLVDHLKDLPQVEALSIVGADGSVLNFSRQFPPPSLDLSDRDFYQHYHTYDDHADFVGAPVKSRATREWVVFLSRRINGANGEFAGVIMALISLSQLENFFTAAMPSGGTVTLMRRDGIILVHTPHAEQQIGMPLPGQAPWYHVANEGGGTYRSPGFLSGIPHLVSVHPLADFPLVINVGITEATALAGWQRPARWLVAGAILAASCAIFLLWVFGAQLHRRMLSEASLARQNAELANKRLQFDAALDNMSQGVTFFDGNMTLIVCNRRYREICRLSPDQARGGTSLSEIIDHRIASGSFPAMTREAYLERRRVLAAAGTPFDVVDELRDGRVVALHYQPMADGGWVTTHEDITERRRAEAELAFMARHDALTRLPNRTLFRERLEQAIATTRRHPGCALLCLDLDGFKLINDTMGHPAGDALLQAVAERLLSVVREVDTVARLGGDEFAIIQVGLEAPHQAAILAERVIEVVGRAFDVDGHKIQVGASIGVSIAPADGMSHDLLLRNADTALYLAKADGRGTYRLFEPEMDARVQGRRLLELDLRDALSDNAFELHYQPVVNLRSGGVVGFEALIRWNHPVRGRVSPVDFIPIAEDTGLIVPIGKWVLRHACLEAMAWPPDIGVAVNLSAIQFKGGRLLDSVREALDASGLAPSRLELEITESVLLRSSEDRLALLHQLRALGVRIALDDFGTGYSSLSYLRSFPFDKIKIDRSFISDITTNADSRVIVSAVIGLAAGLGMTITAEGVERADQLATLREEGCTDVQGNLFSPPLPAGNVPAWIQTRYGQEPPQSDQARHRWFAAEQTSDAAMG